MHKLLTDNAAIYEACERLAEEEFVTVDTEFIREKTYYPKLCLIQIGGTEEAIAIDPLAEAIDLEPVYDLLRNTNVLKIFHACKQDIEIFYHEMGDIPAPLYDTQIAAMVCGYGEQVGYEALVNKMVGAELDKASRYTDWAERPLRQRQIDYAISDVTHLRTIYTKLRENLHAEGRDSWIEEEMAGLYDPSLYAKDPMLVWKKLKMRNRKPAFLNLLRSVAAWREVTAQTKNRPRNWIMRDEVVSEVAHYAPSTVEELSHIRGIGNNLRRDETVALLEAIAEAKSTPKDAWPNLPKPKPIAPEIDGVIDVLKLLLRMQCGTYDVVPRLVASREDLLSIALGEATDEHPVMHGWRYEVFGKHAEAFVKGELMLSAIAGEGVKFIAPPDKVIAYA